MEELGPLLWDAVEVWFILLGIWLDETDTEWPLDADVDADCEWLADCDTLDVCTREELLGDELD